MKSSLIKLSLLFVLLAAVPQMSAATFVGVAQNANSAATMAPQPKPHPSPCRWKCRKWYSRCLHAAGADPAKRKACAIKYRTCLRHCGR